VSPSGSSADTVAPQGARAPSVPLVVIAGALAVGASLYVSPGGSGLAGATLAILMLVIAVEDWRRFVIPNALNLLAVGLRIVDIGFERPDDFAGAILEAVLRAIVAAGVFLAFRFAYRNLRGREGMGLGDVKLGGVAGLWLSWPSLPIALEIAALSGLAIALSWRVRSRGGLGPFTKLPFGAVLAPAIWLCWLLERWAI
jgi:leader peptidase (prepilin peptidase)/N-methyltransferase